MKSAKAKVRGADLLPEYDFSRGVRGKYARRFAQGTNLVGRPPRGIDDATEPLVQLATRIPERLHRQVRVHCTRADISAMDFIAEALREALMRAASRRAK